MAMLVITRWYTDQIAFFLVLKSPQRVVTTEIPLMKNGPLGGLAAKRRQGCCGAPIPAVVWRESAVQEDWG